MSTEHSEHPRNRYILLDLIGTGGMAEVYRCKLSGGRGFEKLVVLKKLLPQCAKDPDIVATFIDEAKLAALLQHENIAQIYDFGEIDGSYFIAMEYLFGQDLASVMQRARERSGSMAPEHALSIAARICEGMEYAHTRNDLQHRPLNIIHRDLSPQNVFITYEGKVKIIDFGIAKAAMFDHRTRTGMVKGKVAYMSPEQLTGSEIDRRSDIFAIGILLYEMLSGRRMYSGDTATVIRKCMQVEYDTLDGVVAGLPAAAYEIVARALQPERAHRYQSCGQMLAAIEECLFAMNTRPSAYFLENFILRLFADEFSAEKNRLQARMETPAPDIDPGGDERTVVLVSPKPGGKGPRGFDRSAAGLAQFCRKTGHALGRIRLSAWLAAGGAAAVLVFFLFIFPAPDIEDLPATAPGPSPQTRPAAVATPSAALENQAVEPAASANEIEDLLLKAAKAWNEKRLIVPEYDSAFRYYRKVLAIDPKNRDALQGIEQLGEYYGEIARQELAGDNFQEAEQAIEKGLMVAPDNARLLSLHDGLAAGKEKAIGNLAEKAERALHRNDLTTPADDCAYKYYRQMLDIDSRSPTALRGIEKIADRYAALAEDAYRNLRIANARAYVRKGLAVAPHHPELLQLQKDLTRSRPGMFFKSVEKSFRGAFR